MAINYMDFTRDRVVAIPVIQRDYVQGAEQNSVKRDEFLTTLFQSLRSKDGRVNLDFIYGTLSAHVRAGRPGHESLPVDGQQRLTTLYLLAWLLAQRGLEPEQKKPEVPWLDYRTRPAAQQFVDELRGYALPETLDLCAPDALSRHLREVPDWFADDWLQDPSVKAMLEMLDAMNNLLNQDLTALPGMARKFFFENPIYFEFLDMADYSLNEDLYIKMNARGKPLTNFENWKAEFGKFLKEKYPWDRYSDTYTIPEYFDYAIEQPWCDLFWDSAIKKWIRDSGKNDSPFPRIDDFFMNFFDQLTELLFYAQRDVINEVDKCNAGLAKDDPRKLSYAQLFAGPGNAWRHKNTFVVYEKKENVLLLFHLLDFFSTLKNTSGGIKGFFEGLLTAEPLPDDPDKVNIFCAADTTLNLFGEIISPEKTTPQQYRLLFYGICKRALKYGTDNTHNRFSDFIRVFWGWILGIRQLDRENLNVVSDLRVETLRHADQILEALLGDADVFAVLDGAPALVSQSDEVPKPVLDALQGEIQKAGWRQKGKYDAIKLLSQFPELRGDLHHLYPALKVLSGVECVKRFRNFCAAPDEERIRRLCIHGFTGVSTWNGNYRYYGSKGQWELIFAEKGIGITRALTRLLLEKNARRVTETEMRWYLVRYQAFRTSSRISFFYVEAPFTVWTLRKGKGWRRGFAHCPYAYTVVALLAPATKQCLGVEESAENRSHGRVWLNAAGVSLECVERGWNIECVDPEKAHTSPVFQRFILNGTGMTDTQNAYTFNGTVLEDLSGKDRIETAVAFLNDLELLL